jgi:ribosome-associated translation inhibitor RaiA
MDIKVDKDHVDGNNYFENYAIEKLKKYFDNYSFIESIKIFCRGSKHKYKKIKLHIRLKGKDVFVEARGGDHDHALDVAADKLYNIAEKYKTKHYKRA